MSTKHRILVILNTLSLTAMLFANYAATNKMLFRSTVADISHKYDTLFAPAGYAFIIWSVIFLFCIAFVIYQWRLLKRGDPGNYIERTGIWFTISNLANGLWLYCWTNEWLGLSVIIILILLVSLCVLVIRLRLELDDEPVRTVFFVWWPIAVYLGWIMVATIACVSAWLVYSGWHGGSWGEQHFTVIMIVISCLLYILLVTTRNLRESAAIGIWAYIAIAVRQWDNNNSIAIAAIGASVILLAVTSVHAYKNRKYNLGEKIKRGEWEAPLNTGKTDRLKED